MGHRVALTVLATATVVGVLGCGSATHAYNAAVKTAECAGDCGAGSQFPNRRYTIKQVAAAFAAHGLGLRKVKNVRPLGYTLLLHGHKQPQLVTVVVFRPHGADVHLLGSDSRAEGRYHAQRDGNVYVYFDPSNTQPVTAALASLH